MVWLMINQFQQYPYMTDVSGMGNGMQDTRSQDALHQALLLRTSQMNPQTQPSQQNNNMLAQMLRSNKSTPSNPMGNNINPATGQDWSAEGSGYAGNGGYYPNGEYGGIDSWLNGTSGIDNSALGGYDTSGLGSFDLSGAGSSLDGIGSGLSDVWGGLGDGFASIGDWFGSLFGSGGALEGAGAVAEEAAPAAAAAA
jgi:hypothetical protein